MLQRLVQTTVSSIRTVSRCPEARELGLEAVKVKLESQLEEQDEEVYTVHTWKHSIIEAQFCNALVY